MNDREYAKQKKRIKALIDEFFKPLGFGWYTVDFRYDRDLNGDNTNVAATTHVDWHYMQATITFFVPRISDLTDEELYGVVIHELCHIIVAPLQADPSNATWELTTELVARTVRFAINVGAKDET